MWFIQSGVTIQQVLSDVDRQGETKIRLILRIYDGILNNAFGLSNFLDLAEITKPGYSFESSVVDVKS